MIERMTHGPHADGMNGALAREVRAELGRTGRSREELAKTSGIPIRTLHRYLNFERHINLRTVGQLAAGLKLSTNELLTRALNERQR